MILRMALIEVRAAANAEVERIKSIAKWLVENCAASANVSLPIAGSIVVYSDGSYRKADSVVLGAN
jgi:hypothetical protein